MTLKDRATDTVGNSFTALFFLVMVVASLGALVYSLGESEKKWQLFGLACLALTSSAGSLIAFGFARDRLAELASSVREEAIADVERSLGEICWRQMMEYRENDGHAKNTSLLPELVIVGLRYAATRQRQAMAENPVYGQNLVYEILAMRAYLEGIGNDGAKITLDLDHLGDPAAARESGG